jgi:hypothetical protein
MTWHDSNIPYTFKYFSCSDYLTNAGVFDELTASSRGIAGALFKCFSVSVMPNTDCNSNAVAMHLGVKYLGPWR